MRVIEPVHFKSIKQPVGKRRRAYWLLLLFPLVGVLVAVQLFANKPPKQAASESIVTVVPAKKQQLDKPKEYNGNQFKDLYRQVMQAYPNTQPFLQMPAITGNEEADKHVRQIAEARGFQQTRLPVTALVKTNEPLLKGETDDLLQPLAYQSWLELKKAAEKDNIPIALLSAYRSPDWQRNLFMTRLGGAATPEQIGAGTADDAVVRILSSTSVPGYSRHHTGYTVDFWCDDGASFGKSTCYQWLKANNYLHAKEAGWIPSYPEDADEQGPEPEPWEYVWVGRDILYAK